MRYTESREQSAQVLRLAVAHMGEHEASFNPITYAVWYEHLAGFNPALSQALTALIDARGKLDTDAILGLHAAYVGEVNAADTERIGEDAQRVMHQILEVTKQTGETAMSYVNKLDALGNVILDPEPLALNELLREALNDTRVMQKAVITLQQAVVSGEGEIENLQRELKRAKAEVLVDPLTGLCNRKGFDVALAALLGSPPAGKSVHCLVMFDIDHFKAINDTHGHLTGDVVLKELGAIISRETPESNAVCARYGGEEFAIILGHTPLAKANAIASRVCQLVRSMKVRHRTSGQLVGTVTVSGGLAVWQPGEDSTALIASADAALYRSKRAGRDRLTLA